MISERGHVINDNSIRSKHFFTKDILLLSYSKQKATSNIKFSIFTKTRDWKRSKLTEIFNCYEYAPGYKVL